jgi:hypothetical protein
MPTPQEFCRFFGRRKTTPEDVLSIALFDDLNNFFISQQPKELKTNEFNALKYRWGFSDGIFHKLKETSIHYGVDINRLLDLEIGLIQRLGFYIKSETVVRKQWLNT